jgi:glycosyltransferase involved in cell wall biosynthesis
MKILFLNNYDMAYYWNACQNGQEPKHHLWGTSELAQHDMTVEVLPFSRFKRLKELSRRWPMLGDLDQQIRVLLGFQPFDIIYSGHYFSTILLALLRGLKLFPKPIVAIAYQSLEKNIWSQIFMTCGVRGYDKIVCLSQAVWDNLHDDFGIPEDKLQVIFWGADVSFYPAVAESITESKRTRRVVSTGRTSRDYDTLVEAFQHIDGELEIYGWSPTVTPPWPAYIQRYQEADVVAIPIGLHPAKPPTGNGYSTFLDAIALGKPMVMTRNPSFAVDVEAAGIGLWAEPNDPQSWQYAISYLLDNPAIAQEMGERGRNLCETQYNLHRFATALAQILNQFRSD